DACARIVGEFAFEHMGRTKADLNDLRTTLNMSLSMRNGFAVVAGEKFGKAVVFSFEQLWESAKHPNTALRIRRSPCRLGSLCIFHGCANFVLSRQRHFGLNCPVERLKNIGCATAFAGNVLSADKMPDITHR